MIELKTLLIFALAISVCSITVAKGKIFTKTRTQIARRNVWLSKLVRCPYCLSHWFGILLVTWHFLGRPMTWSGLVYVGVSVFATVGLANVISGFILAAISGMDSMIPEEDERETF